MNPCIFSNDILTYTKGISPSEIIEDLAPFSSLFPMSHHKELHAWSGHLPPSSETISADVDPWPKGLSLHGGQPGRRSLLE